MALARLDGVLLDAGGALLYAHSMVVDGNDERANDVGVMTMQRRPIAGVRSHLDDADTKGNVFSSDRLEYEVILASGQRVWILVNYLESEGSGSAATNSERRKRQATRSRPIYDALRTASETFVASMGNLNDTLHSEPLKPLLADRSDLKDVSDRPTFQDGGRPSTFGNRTAASEINYNVMSPAPFARVSAGSIFRTGAWAGTNGTL